MHERPLYYVFALFVALMVINLISPAFGDGEIGIETHVNGFISANHSLPFIDVTSPVSVKFTLNTNPTINEPGQPDTYNWTIKERNATSAYTDKKIAPINWITYTFTDPGQYQVFCIVSNSTSPSTQDSINATSFTYGFVTAYLPVSANFTNTTTTGVLPLRVNFTDNSSGRPDNYQWQLNDGRVGNQTVNPTFALYETNGTKIINYTVWNSSYNSPLYDDGGKRLASSISRSIYIDSRQDIVPSFKTNISTFTTQAKGLVPLHVVFNNTSTGDPRDTFYWNWTFQGGVPSTSTLQNDTVIYNTPGLYNVTLRVTGNWSERTAFKEKYVNAYYPISANFSHAPHGMCVPLAFPVTYDFKTNATKDAHTPPNAYNWSFEDGTPNETTRDTSHVFNLPGQYNVTLTTYNTTHGINTTERKKVLISGLYANFTADRYIGYQENTGEMISVNFTNASDVTGASYFHWDFGNGGSSNHQYGHTSYNKPGIYNVVYTVGNTIGNCREYNSTSQNITIIERPLPNFTYSPSYGTFPLSVQFTDLTTDSPDQYQWDFGDGSLPITDISNPVHSYEKPGKYWVNLTVWNITVSPVWRAEKGNWIYLSEGFNTKFEAEPVRGVWPLNVSFTDKTEPAYVTNWEWDFGDNSPINNQKNPNHTYYAAGNYLVNLTVRNSTTHAIGTNQTSIEVVDPLVANFEPNRTARMNASVGVQFNDLSTGDIEDWIWNFGDDSPVSYDQNPLHIFPEFKEYNVNLTISNGYYNDTASVNYTVNVTEMRAPLADFTGSPKIVDPEVDVYFEQKAQGPEISSYLWDFGDGQTSTNANPSHRYGLPGKYDVSLTVTNPWGTDTETKTQYIAVTGLIPGFMTIPSDWAVINTPVTFIDTSYGSPVNWQWDFDDGTIESSPTGTTTHTFTKNGTYTVNMTVTNWQPVTGSISKQITITDKTVPQGVDFNIPEQKYSGNSPLYVQFEDTTPAQANVVEWLWEFGDGTNSFEKEPNHTYKDPGQYTVILTVRNDAGTNEKRRVAYVVVL